MRFLNGQVGTAVDSPQRDQAVRDRALVGLGLMAGLQAEVAVPLRESRLILTRGTAEARDIVGKYGYVRSIPLK